MVYGLHSREHCQTLTGLISDTDTLIDLMVVKYIFNGT